MKETERLYEIDFEAYIKYGMIWVSFKSPVISQLLHGFLERQGFAIYIDRETGMTTGVWISGPYPKEEYEKLRETFKSYKVDLPALHL